jgi:hypothetical protein
VDEIVRTAFRVDPNLASIEAAAIQEGALIAEVENEGALAQLEQMLANAAESDPEDDVAAAAKIVEAFG